MERDDDTREIKIVISSPGGSVQAGLALYDTIKLLKSPVTTIVCGMAASMGRFFFWQEKSV